MVTDIGLTGFAAGCAAGGVAALELPPDGRVSPTRQPGSHHERRLVDAAAALENDAIDQLAARAHRSHSSLRDGRGESEIQHA